MRLVLTKYSWLNQELAISSIFLNLWSILSSLAFIVSNLLKIKSSLSNPEPDENSLCIGKFS